MGIYCLSVQLSAEVSTQSTSTTLPSANRNPLVQIYGLLPVQDLGILADQLDRGDRLPQIQLNLANYSVSSQSHPMDAEGNITEEIVLDGELFYANLALRFGLSSNSALGVNLPYIAHHSGNSDQSIEKFHSLFGLPNGDRSLRARDLLSYSYSANGKQLLLFDRNARGAGDISFEWSYLNAPAMASALDRRRTSPRHLHGLRFGLKLPTGSRNKLTGSGTTDLSVEWNTASTHLSKLNWQTGAGALWLGGGGILADIRKQWVGFASGSAAYKLTPAAAFKIQLKLHTPFYKSRTDELGDTAGQLAVGINFVMSQELALDIFFTEDIVTTTSPDFGLGMALRFHPAERR